MNKEKYLGQVENRLKLIFQASKDGYKSSPTERHRLEGFMHAGVVLGLVSNVELAALMNEIHLKIFGKTIKQRKTELASNWREEIIDYGQYEQPTYERFSDNVKAASTKKALAEYNTKLRDKVPDDTGTKRSVTGYKKLMEYRKAKLIRKIKANKKQQEKVSIENIKEKYSPKY